MPAFTFSFVRPILGSQQYTVNAVWIQNAGWVAMNQNILTTNLTKVVNDLENGNITFAFVFTGYWDASSSTVGYAEPDSVWTTVINALHAVNIKVLAWVENAGTMNVSSTNWPILFSQIGTCMSKGFDGYNDDIEDWNGTLQNWIDWENNCTLYVHSLGKIMTADVGYDWQQNTNPYLHMDYIVSMFYSSRSTLESPQAAAFWQEDFGEYSGHNDTPASPMIMGLMNYYGNTNPLAWQLNEVDNYLAAYGHPQLVGFCVWLYEYMGTNPDDWTQWDYWIARVGTATPPLYTVTVDFAPIGGIQIGYNGIQHYTPYVEYAFTGTMIVNAPSSVDYETHHVLWGESDHTGGQEGFSIYTYASGPYNVPSCSISSLYFYSPEAGNVKLAIYNATEYAVSGWVGTDWHPYMLQTQSQPTKCEAGSWNLIDLPTVALSAGIYFIVIKGNTTGMIGVSGMAPEKVGGAIYGYDQFITESYTVAFDQTFPTVEGSMESDASVYVPTAPLSLTRYYFSQWQDNSTSPTQTINLNESTTLIADYLETLPSQHFGSICVQGTSSGLNVAFEAWIDNGTTVQVPTSGFTFANVTIGSHTVYARFNGTTYDAAANVADNTTTTIPFDFGQPTIAEMPNIKLVLMVIGIATICAVAYRVTAKKWVNLSRRARIR